MLVIRTITKERHKNERPKRHDSELSYEGNERHKNEHGALNDSLKPWQFFHINVHNLYKILNILYMCLHHVLNHDRMMSVKNIFLFFSFLTFHLMLY